jgi:carboxymethylenebutenolidase
MTMSTDSTGAVLVRAQQQTGVLVLLHSWWGCTEHFHTLAGRLADAGFSTVLADLYAGSTTDDPVRARELRVALSDQDALARAGAAMDLARQQDAPLGLIGFSMGAEFAIRLAASRKNEVRALVAYYGLCVPADGLGAVPVLAHVAAQDEFVTPQEVGEFTEHALAGQAELALFSYPGTTHAFANRSRPEAYHPEAAALSWERTLDFLRRQLG